MYQAESEFTRVTKEVCIESQITEIEELIAEIKHYVKDYMKIGKDDSERPQPATFLDGVKNRLINIRNNICAIADALANIKRKLGNL